jgi:hypothetical protein
MIASEKTRLVTTLLQENEVLENRVPRNRITDRRKRRLTPTKGAIRIISRYRICIKRIP